MCARRLLCCLDATKYYTSSGSHFLRAIIIPQFQGSGGNAGKSKHHSTVMPLPIKCHFGGSSSDHVETPWDPMKIIHGVGTHERISPYWRLPHEKEIGSWKIIKIIYGSCFYRSLVEYIYWSTYIHGKHFHFCSWLSNCCLSSKSWRWRNKKNAKTLPIIIYSK